MIFDIVSTYYAALDFELSYSNVGIDSAFIAMQYACFSVDFIAVMKSLAKCVKANTRFRETIADTRWQSAD